MEAAADALTRTLQDSPAMDALADLLLAISSTPIEERRMILFLWISQGLLTTWLAAGLWAVLMRVRHLRHAPLHRAIVLFDGSCVLCNGFVDFCIARDRDKRISVAPLDSELAISLMTAHKIEQPPKSFVLVEGETAYTRSDASLRTLSLLRPRMLWPLMMMFDPVPQFLRDAVYDFGWAHRRAIFGTCDCQVERPGRMAATTTCGQ